MIKSYIFGALFLFDFALEILQIVNLQLGFKGRVGGEWGWVGGSEYSS